jgi:hypothetical protein
VYQLEALIMADLDKAPSEDSFEFVETPPAPRSEAAAPDCGVRTTDVRPSSTHVVQIWSRELDCGERV